MEVKRIFDIAQYQKKLHPLKDAFAQKIKGNWVAMSTESFIEQANLISKGLIKLGIKPQDKIALITTTNCTQWSICDIGILQIGAVSVPVYPTSSKKDYEYIFNHSEAKLCIVSDEALYEKVIAIRGKVGLKNIYSFEKIKGVKNWEEIKKLGSDQKEDNKLQKLKSKIRPNDLATIIYTSGTTGTPKGVMLSHNNIVSNVLSACMRIPKNIDRVLSFLPCCHVYERTMLYIYQYKCASIYFAEGIDFVGENIREIQPSYISVVPRLLEKVYDKIVAKGSELKGIKRVLFFWALNLGHRYRPYEKMNLWYNLQLSIARKLVFVKWREALGGRLIGISSGSAALQVRLIRIFNAAGIPVFEGYGATETSPIVSTNSMEKGYYKIGTVGKPIPKVKVKISHDGEILVKGPNIMLGYYKDSKKTDEAINEGYYKTGDIGVLEDGFLRITDRKKEIFKTSGGKYIAPQMIENLMKQSRFIEQIMVVGEGEKMPCALVQLDFYFVREWMKRKGLNWEATQLEISTNEEVKKRIIQEVEYLGMSLGKWERIKRIELTPDIWSIEQGHLTPTMKLKRKNVLDKYEYLYKQLYI